MHYEQRKVYIDLTDLVHRGLCNVCKFAEWTGYSCSEMDLDCKHPLNEEFELIEPSDAWQGDDCWLFRPNQKPHEIAEWVGIILEGNIPDRRNGELVAVIPNDNDRWMGLVG